jgi:hypothetical protein
MAQLSRPFQIALGAVLLIALFGVIALHVHGSNPSEPAPTSAPTLSTATPKVTTSAAAHKSAGPPTTAHEGTAHGADPRSQNSVVVAHKADPRSQKSVVVAHKTTSHLHTTTTAITHKTTTHKTSTHKTVVVVHKTASSSHKTTLRSSGDATSPTSKHTPEQAVVEHELAQGKTVMLVFWNPQTSVDREVQAQARALASGSKGTVTLHSALANQVGLFGSITEVVHVYQTPMILIVNRHGVVSTLTGLTDVFALQQAVAEAQHASH